MKSFALLKYPAIIDIYLIVTHKKLRLYRKHRSNFSRLCKLLHFQRENKKGQVELSLCQEKSDKKDGSGGRLVLTLLRLRCSLQSMHEHEGLKGQMYIKMSVVDGGRVTHFWKSDRFAPSVSMKFDAEQAQVAVENPYEGALKDVSFVVKFVSKNKLGKHAFRIRCISAWPKLITFDKLC